MVSPFVSIGDILGERWDGVKGKFEIKGRLLRGRRGGGVWERQVYKSDTYIWQNCRLILWGCAGRRAFLDGVILDYSCSKSGLQGIQHIL